MRALPVFLCFVFAGCGVLDDDGPALTARPDPAVFGPATASADAPEAPAPSLRPPSRAVATALDRGVVGVVDVAGLVDVRPEVLETSSDAVVEEIAWSRWDAEGAAGSGSLRVLSCQPTCAGGRVERVRARVVLSGVVRCDGRRYFAGAAVAPESGEPPASYVRAPC